MEQESKGAPITKPPPTATSTEDTQVLDAAGRAGPTLRLPAVNEPAETDSTEPGSGAAQAEDRPAFAGVVPQLAPGVDLVGEYEGSGYREPHYIARRADGQVIQLSHLLFLTASHVDGRRGATEIAARVSDEFGKGVSGGNVETLLEKLVPLGIVQPPDGRAAELVRADPMLALKFRTRVVPERLVRFLTFVFQPLFWPPVVLAVLAGLVAMDVYVFGIHGVAQGTRQVLYTPALMLAVLGLLVLSAMFHECGHATACRYGGAKPGVMGVGIYVVWPALYTDVTDAYRLSRGGRLRTDLGGLYFNTIFMLATTGVFLVTAQEWLLVVIVAQHIQMIHQLLPFLRLDGYYIVADLTGVPDMFMRIRPVLASLIPWKKADPRVTELKVWARVVVTLWVLLMIPFLLFVVVNVVIAAPRVVATAWDSFFSLYDKVGAQFDAGETAAGIISMLQMAFLVLPIGGIAVTFARLGGRTARGAWRWSEGSVGRRALALASSAALLAGIAYLWLPNGEYTPIQPGEKGTIGDSIAAMRVVAGGAPSVDYASGGRGGLTADDLRNGTWARTSSGGVVDGVPSGSDGDAETTEETTTDEEAPAEGGAAATPTPAASPEPAEEATPEAEIEASPAAEPSPSG